MHIEVV